MKLQRLLFYRALVKAGFRLYMYVEDPHGLLRSDGKRPDIITLILWIGCSGLVWDATVVDTLVPIYIPASATRAGAAAGFTSDMKNQKHIALLDTRIFILVAIGTQ